MAQRRKQYARTRGTVRIVDPAAPLRMMSGEELWSPMHPAPAAGGPPSGQGREWEREAIDKYWELRNPAGSDNPDDWLPEPTQERMAAELITNARYLRERDVLGLWKAFLKRAEAARP